MEKRFFRNIETCNQIGIEVTDYMRNREMIKKNNILRELVQSGLTFEELETDNREIIKIGKRLNNGDTKSPVLIFILGVLVTLGFLNLVV